MAYLGNRPPRQLVRNPMYVGVVAIVLGTALITGSPLLGGYAAIVAAIFHIRVVVFEERGSRAAFPTTGGATLQP